MRVRVQCIKKREHPNPHERIRHVGGVSADGSGWRLTENEAIDGIETGKYDLYVSVNNHQVDVVVATHQGRKYLKTRSDGYAPNTLLSLPDCP